MTDTITQAAELLRQVAGAEKKAKQASETENARHLKRVQAIDATRKAAIAKLYADAPAGVRAQLKLAAEHEADGAVKP